MNPVKNRARLPIHKCYIANVSVIESIIKDLQSLPTPKLVEVARYVHGLSQADQQTRQAFLRQTYGVLSEEDGRAFEMALQGARHLEA